MESFQPAFLCPEATFSCEAVKPGGPVGKGHSFCKARLYFDCYGPRGHYGTSPGRFSPIWGKLGFCLNSFTAMAPHGEPNSISSNAFACHLAGLGAMKLSRVPLESQEAAL